LTPGGQKGQEKGEKRRRRKKDTPTTIIIVIIVIIIIFCVVVEGKTMLAMVSSGGGGGTPWRQVFQHLRGGDSLISSSLVLGIGKKPCHWGPFVKF